MDHWLFLLGIATALFVAGFVLKAALGLVFRYLLFLALALVVTAERYGGSPLAWLDAGMAARTAVIAAAALAATSLLLAVTFKKSPFRPVMLPLFGLGTTMALTAALTTGPAA